MPITTQGSFRIKDRDVNMPQFEVNNPYHSQGLAAGGSALLDAINRGKVHLAKFILDAGESNVVNTRDFKGKTSLIRACYIKVGNTYQSKTLKTYMYPLLFLQESLRNSLTEYNVLLVRIKAYRTLLFFSD